MKTISLKKIIGRGYTTFWRDKSHRYICVKGGRGSKKSKTTALWIIYHMMRYPLSNTLVVRRVFNTLRDSCWTDLKWGCAQLGVSELWQFNKSPLEAIYLPTGQKILFRGLDDPMSITSITVEKGCLCWCWIEEAYQVESEDAFNKLDMSIRGELPEGLFFRIMITFNPWSEHHWLKKRFFDSPDNKTLALTTTYRCNEWIGQDFIDLMEDMKVNNPRRYNIEGEGNWGVSEGLVFTNWVEQEFEEQEIAKRKGIISSYGLDWGYTNDPTAFVSILIDKSAKEIYVCDEHYERGMSNEAIAQMLKYKGYSKCRLICDSAEPKSIDRLKTLGIKNVTPAKKGKDSIINGIDTIQDYKIIVHPKCENFIVELSNYSWGKDKNTGEFTNNPEDDWNHLMDCFRYAMEIITMKSKKINKKVTRNSFGL